MKRLEALFRLIGTLLRTVLYDWVLRLLALLRELAAQCRAAQRKNRLPVRLRRSSPFHCVPLSDPAYKRPDPMIYDQYFLMKQGLAVTWDNPDIEVRKGNVVVPSHALQPDTQYRVIARIWNNSTEAPVAGLPVRLSYLSFGVGTQSHFVGQTAVNLGVKGGPNHPAFAEVPWKTPSAPGHYCLQVVLDWLDDVNPNNNLGQENADVVAAHSPAEFAFQLRNDTRRRQEYRFEVDTYAIPPRLPCSQRPPPEEPPPRQEPGTINRIPSQHDRRNHPVPADWTIEIHPATPGLDPGAEITVKVAITPPDAFTGRRPFNLHAFNQDGLAGGVTLTVQRP